MGPPPLLPFPRYGREFRKSVVPVTLYVIGERRKTAVIDEVGNIQVPVFFSLFNRGGSISLLDSLLIGDGEEYVCVILCNLLLLVVKLKHAKEFKMKFNCITKKLLRGRPPSMRSDLVSAPSNYRIFSTINI